MNVTGPQRAAMWDIVVTSSARFVTICIEILVPSLAIRLTGITLDLFNSITLDLFNSIKDNRFICPAIEIIIRCRMQGQTPNR
jgi:hypothetical protein